MLGGRRHVLGKTPFPCRMPPMQDADALLASLTPAARGAPPSGIVDVVNYARTKPGLIPLWVGEGDLSTPISSVSGRPLRCMRAKPSTHGSAASRSCAPRSPPIMRGFMAAARLISRPSGFFVTGSGMQAVQIAVRMIAGPGDELLIPTPAWPNFAAAIGISGANAGQRADGGAGRRLPARDLQRLAAAITPRTRALVINSPSNPTGLDRARAELEGAAGARPQARLWIIADEIYGRFVYDGALRSWQARQGHARLPSMM